MLTAEAPWFRTIVCCCTFCLDPIIDSLLLESSGAMIRIRAMMIYWSLNKHFCVFQLLWLHGQFHTNLIPYVFLKDHLWISPAHLIIHLFTQLKLQNGSDQENIRNKMDHSREYLSITQRRQRLTNCTKTEQCMQTKKKTAPCNYTMSQKVTLENISFVLKQILEKILDQVAYTST